MKTILFILALLLTNTLKSQIPVEAFTHALQSKRYSTFQKVFKKAYEKDSLVDFGNSSSRVVFQNYKEVYYQLFNRLPLDGNTHHLKMIVKGNEIIYYHFSFVKVDIQGKKRDFTTVPIDTFVNISKYNAFKSAFRSIYEADLIETDLYSNNKIVGQFCGLRITTDNFKDYDKMIDLANTNKRDSLLLWLQSANIEKQLFGIWGYHLFIQKKLALSTLESRLIKTILAKKAKGFVCDYGCGISYLTPREFVKEYKLEGLPH